MAELLQSLGGCLGPPEALMPATEANPRGHFEALPIVAMNEELLAIGGGHWLVPHINSDALRSCASDPALRSAALDALAATGYRNDDGQVFVVKDPRFCLTLPFWQEVVGEPITLIAMYRDPDQVAKSLHARDAIDHSYGLYLWNRYNEELLSHLDPQRTLAVSYHDLLHETDPIVDELCELLPALTRGSSLPIDKDLQQQDVQPSAQRNENRVWQALSTLNASRDQLVLPDPASPPDAVSPSTLAYLGRESAQLRVALSEVQRDVAHQRTVHTEQLAAHQQVHENLKSELELMVANMRHELTACQTELDKSQASLHAYESSRAAIIVRAWWWLRRRLQQRIRSN